MTKPARRSRILASLSHFIPLLLLAPSVAAQAPGFDAARALARSADVNGDGELDTPEWQAFLASLRPDDEGVIERHRVKARLFALDADGDGKLTTRDVELVLEGRDLDGDGQREGGFLVSLLPLVADVDGDGMLTEEERSAFLAAARAAEGEEVPEDVVLGWLRAAEAIPPVDRNAVTPGVLLVSLDPVRDTDATGASTTGDLETLRASLDTNADGKIDAQELRPRRRQSRAGDMVSWGVSAEARRRPPLMPWQRSIEDALALSAATGKPLLLCCNMDGESASENLAWDRYRDPQFRALVDGFIPLLASPDRRELRDRDDRGRRLPDRRFGRLLNSEHIDIEPLLYELYFRGSRIAPRHVGVSPEGEILFDVYMLNDLTILDEKLREFGNHDVALPDPATLSEQELLASHDAAARELLEARFAEGDERTRARLTGLALSEVRDVQHPELLRMAFRDPSAAVRRQALWNFFQHAQLGPLDQLPMALALCSEEPELRATLILALRRCVDDAENTRRGEDAAFYLRVFSGLYRSSAHVDVERWRLALAQAPPILELPPQASELDDTVELLEDVDAALAKAPGDLDLMVRQVAVRMHLARVQLAAGNNPTFFLLDVVEGCERALAIDPEEGHALGYHAWASYMLSDMEKAGEMAAAALPHLVRNASDSLAAEVLNVLATVRAQALYQAISAGVSWDEELIPDALAAYEALLLHPKGVEAHWISYLELLGTLRAHGLQLQVVRRALEHFPLHGDLHSWLRFLALQDGGARTLEAAYEEDFLATARSQEGPTLDWYHGLATLVAAERDVANRDPDAALEAYARCQARFRRALEAAPDLAGSAQHYQALAHAGTARILAQSGAVLEAVEAIVMASQIAPGSFQLADGLGKTPATSAGEVLASLRAAGLTERADALAAELEGAGLELPRRTRDRR